MGKENRILLFKKSTLYWMKKETYDKIVQLKMTAAN